MLRLGRIEWVGRLFRLIGFRRRGGRSLRLFGGWGGRGISGPLVGP